MGGRLKTPARLGYITDERRKTMDNKRIARILEAHNIPYYCEGGRIYADTMEAGTEKLEHVEDLTGYSVKALRDWLGY